MKKHHIVSIILAILAALGLILFTFTQVTAPNLSPAPENVATSTPATGESSDEIVPITKSLPPAKPNTQGIVVGEPHPITVRGSSTCLEFKDQTGPHIMSCAMGLKSLEGKFYALSDTSTDYENIQKISGEGTFEIKGLFTPASDPVYVSEGVIQIESVTKI